MKQKLKLLMVFLALVMVAKAQDNDPCLKKYGANDKDSVTCVENLSVYTTPYFKNGQYEEAVKYWRKCIEVCPCSRKSLYINGAKMYKKFLDGAEKGSDVYKALYDTLLHIYDQRIIYFKQEGFVLGRKGSDMLKYDKDNPKAAFEVLQKSLDLQGNKMEGGAMVKYYQAAYYMYRKKELEKSALIEMYPGVMEVVDYNLANDEKHLKTWHSVAANIDKIFVGVSSCDDIVKVFKPRFDSNKEDTTLLKSMLKALQKKECTDDPLYLEAAIALDKIRPSFQSKYSIGLLSAKGDKCGQAIGYFKQASELAANDNDKVEALMYAAKCSYNAGQLQSCRSYCLLALRINPNLGDAYMLIGDAYAKAAGDCGDSNCTKKAAYWAAADKYERARSVDPEVASDAAKRIANVTAYFPKKEDCFFEGINDDSKYTVGCWINEETTVRTRPQ